MKFFVKQDLDGFFGLAVDNLIQLLLIVALCTGVCHFPAELTYGRILPASALSILFGNLYYALKAHQLARKEGRDDVCALPYGINTVSLFAFVFFVILPVYQLTKNPLLAWRAGVLACFLSALIEIAGSFVGDWIRRWTPRAALLAALAGIAITFIAMDFAFKTFAKPLIAVIPLFIILATYFARIQWRFGVPGGLYAVIAGSALAWILGEMEWTQVVLATDQLGLSLPRLAIGDLWQVFHSPYVLAFISIIIPMGLFNVIGSLQNIESASAAGDSYGTRGSLLINGLGSLVAALFGSPFPTTIYIGHPGWKALGARAGYSVLNGFFIAGICLIGAVPLINALMPLEAGVAIVLWIGIIIMAQAFQATPAKHAPAVAVGLLPALAGWALLIIQGTLFNAGSSLELIGKDAMIQSYSLKGIIVLSQGFILTSMVWAALCVFLIDRQFIKASLWAVVAAILAFFGVIHTSIISGNDVLYHYGWGTGLPYALAYLGGGVLFIMININIVQPKNRQRSGS